MTYYDELSTEYSNTIFLKFVFCKWAGSVYKLLWKDMIVFFTVFFIIQITYRFAMNEACQTVFEAIVTYASASQENTPLAFLLGFFVESVFELWDQQWKLIPWMTTLAIQVSSSIHGFDEVGRALRRTIIRYAMLTRTIVFRKLSPKMMRRFPLKEDLITAGLINRDELDIIDMLDERFPNNNKYWLPTVWAATLATKARKEGRIRDDFALKKIIESLNHIQDSSGALMSLSFVYIPLVQTQVVALAVYTYFLTGLFAHQCIVPTEESLPFDFMPVILILRFLFYMGWLKVAETMMNPYGDDDFDFDLSGMTDTHLQIGYLIVDEMHAEHPELLKDRYWDGIPRELPDPIRDVIRKKKSLLNEASRDDVQNTVSVKDFSAASSSHLLTSSLKPSWDIIDDKYLRISNLIASHTSLARDMERIRKRSQQTSAAINEKED